ncbi:MAG: gliding motility-associated C-terminal domain-containing protein [Bacteroidales bacterium]|nr:gliding motility-associated C-terminal domain-containing protein [Bacteroidales bacterium]
MRKTTLSLLLFILMMNISIGQSLNVSAISTENTICEGIGCEYNGPSILINEVMMSPAQFDGSLYGYTSSHNPNTDCQGEWIELYNPNLCESIDISCYYLGNSANDVGSLYPGGFVLPEGTIVPPRGFVIVRGMKAPAVPTNLLIANGGNTIEIIVQDVSRICFGNGYRLWFPNAGGWFAFYDNNGVAQDAISWGNNTTGGTAACVPHPGGPCNFNGTLVGYNSIPTNRKTYINSSAPASNQTYRRIPDGGAWQINSPTTGTYGICNTTCTEEPIITCNGTATANVSGGSPPYSFLWNDAQVQTSQTAIGLCEGLYCVTVTDNASNTSTTCVEIINRTLTISASSSPANICAGNNLNLTSNSSQGQSPYTFSWTGPSSFLSSVANPTVSNSNIQNSGNYSITVTDANGCTGTAATNVTIHPNPLPIAQNTSPACAGETVGLSVQSFSNYQWQGPASFASTNQNPQITTVTENTAGVYHVTVTNEHGCTANAETIIEILPSPYLSISAESTYCQGENIVLNCSPGGLQSYHWSGPLSYSSNNQNVTLNNSNPNQTGTYTVNAVSTNGCTGTTNININILPQVNATITPVPPLCYNDPSHTLTTITNGGIWSGTGVTGNSFNPTSAGVGEHEISYSVSNEACNDNDQITIEVFENISIINFTDNVCDDTYSEYYVSFDVVNHLGNPTIFLMNTGTGYEQHTGSISLTYPSQTPYNITITDAANNCDQYILEGIRNCGCYTSAGNMSSLQPISLCYGECSDMVTHSGNEALDANDTFGFILHDGTLPINVLATSLTPNFCFHLIPSLSFGTTYFISAVAGNEVSPGIPDYTEHCFSISQGTPVIWYENPIAHVITDNFAICGLEATFAATPPTAGMTGYWNSSTTFWTTNTTTHNSPEISVLVNNYGTHTFYWNINNAGCTGTDEIIIEFVEEPNAFAGNNFSICGLSADLSAVMSHPSSIGSWTGPGTFSSSSSPESNVTSNSGYGSYTFTWRETIGGCWDEDQITIHFIPTPNPIIYPALDTVCGNTYNLSVSNVHNAGIWSAYSNGTPLQPAPLYLQGSTNHNTQVIIPNYANDHLVVEFVWTETSMHAGIQCPATATAHITFARIPIASVGAIDEIEVCGTSTQLNADITGSEFATHSWISNQILAEFDNPHLPNATISLISQGSFGDSAYVRVPIVWAIQNYGCSSIDTMWVTFYDKPSANAGIDNAVCGKEYMLGAVYDITETSSYSPSGWWSVYEKPIQAAQTNIQPQGNDTATCSVSHNGIYQFVFRENNSNLAMCYDTDTVQIEFVEIPIISAGEDKDICGNCTNLEASSGGFQGTWIDNGSFFDDYTNPHTNACRNDYGAIIFAWMESNTAITQNHTCTSQDEVEITFWKVPQADILTDEEDNYACGYTFSNLRAENPGSDITGYWYTVSPETVFGNEFNFSTWARVSSYGYHNFYWIEQTGPSYQPGFCTDTAGPLTIHFIEIPVANAGVDTLFCGKTGRLNAIPSVGTGVWSTPSAGNIIIDANNDPNTLVSSEIYNTDNTTIDFYEFSWIETNFERCSDIDTVNVVFARIPKSDINIIPPKCFGEPASIAADENNLQQYTWNFYSGIIDSTSINLSGGQWENFVHWNNSDTLHRISLITTNIWDCQSPINIDTIYEPKIPKFDVTIISDTCMLGKGGIIFGDTLNNNSFFWLDTVYGPPVESPVTTVYNLPTGEYDIRTSYQTPNMTYYAYYLNTFNSTNCIDTITYTIEPIGMIEAMIEISTATDMTELIAPEAQVIFLNNSIYDNVGKRCEWHFGDGKTLKNCDQQVEHYYTEAGCFNPFLIVMNRDLPECRDTAYLEACIPIDNASKLEVPNIFSPNADGYNDFFQVKAQTLRTFNGIIVNRYGRTIYEWDNWQDYEAGWDGTLSGGTKASPGVYYFIIKAVGMDDQTHDTQGPLHLMRD